MKKALRIVHILSLFLVLTVPTVQAADITVSFTVTRFFGFFGGPAPIGTVTGSIVYDADSRTANINFIKSVNLSIPGQTASNVLFASQFNGYQQIIAGWPGFSTAVNYNDFALVWVQSTLQPLAFVYTAVGSPDAWTSFTFTQFSVTAPNIPPEADAGLGGAVEVGTIAFLEGSGSRDADNDPLTYQWTLVSGPANSQASISEQTAMVASFIPDLPGTYISQLVVNDGQADSIPSTVQFEAFSTPSAAIESVIDIQVYVSSLSALENANMKKALLNKLNAVIADIESGRYADALSKLNDDILRKTNGCATIGFPDQNDWMTTCEEQAQLSYLGQVAIWIIEPLVVP